MIEIRPGDTDLSPERKTMTLKQFADALESQRRDVINYLEGLSESDLKRKARIPIFKEIMGVDELDTVDVPAPEGRAQQFHAPADRRAPRACDCAGATSTCRPGRASPGSSARSRARCTPTSTHR